MKHITLYIIFALLSFRSNAQTMESSYVKYLMTTNCDADRIWNSVYKPTRFIVWDSCYTATVKITDALYEADGDYTMWGLPTDSTTVQLLRSKYDDVWNEIWLKMEIIYGRKPTQLSAKPNYNKGYRNKLVLPKVGQTVSVTGYLVLDRQHWYIEVHPVTKITIIQ